MVSWMVVSEPKLSFTEFSVISYKGVQNEYIHFSDNLLKTDNMEKGQ